MTHRRRTWSSSWSSTWRLHSAAARGSTCIGDTTHHHHHKQQRQSQGALTLALGVTTASSRVVDSQPACRLLHCACDRRLHARPRGVQRACAFRRERRAARPRLGSFLLASRPRVLLPDCSAAAVLLPRRQAPALPAFLSLLVGERERERRQPRAGGERRQLFGARAPRACEFECEGGWW